MATFSPERERVSFDDINIGVSHKPRKSMSSMSSIHEEEEDEAPKRYNRKRNASEWAVLPLKVKFRIKELENIYDRSVYRYQQELLLKACLLVVFVSIATVCVFLGKEKVQCTCTCTCNTCPHCV